MYENGNMRSDLDPKSITLETTSIPYKAEISASKASEQPDNQFELDSVWSLGLLMVWLCEMNPPQLELFLVTTRAQEKEREMLYTIALLKNIIAKSGT